MNEKLEKLNRELEKSEKKLRKAINDEKALQHQLKQLTRKERTHRLCMFFASTFSSKMQIDFLKVAWGISPVLHFLCRHSFRCRRGAVAGIQSLLVTDM